MTLFEKDLQWRMSINTIGDRFIKESELEAETGQRCI